MTAIFHDTLPPDFDPTAPWSAACPKGDCGVEMWGETASAAEENLRAHLRLHPDPLPEIGQRIVRRGEQQIVWEGVVEEIRNDPGFAPQIVARTDEGLMFSCFADGWEAWLSSRQKLAGQIYSEALAQLEELSSESGEFLFDAEDERLAEDLRGSLMAALEQRYLDWLCDNDLAQP